jgi:hypothetical protein
MSDMWAEIPREKLKELVAKNGDSLLQDSDRCEGLLKDHCGSHRREISALVGALEERIPLELKSSWQSAMTPEAMRARLVQRLEENRGLAPAVANWAVDAWSYALGVGLGRRSDRVDDASAAGLAGGAAANNAWAAGSAGPGIAERVASDRAGAASVAEIPSNGASGMSTPKKAGFGAVAALALGLGAFALMHHPAPAPAPAPAPVNPNPKPDVPQGPAGVGDGATVKDDKPDPGHDTPHDPPKFLPAGTVVSVRVDQAINSDAVKVGDTVDATVSSPVTVDGNVIVTTGARAKLRVTGVDHTAKEGGAEHLQLALVDLSTGQGRVQVTTPAHQFDGPTVQQAKRGGISAAAGAVGGFVVGKIFHRGAVTAKPQPVKVAAETPLHFRLSASVKPPSASTAKK